MNKFKKIGLTALAASLVSVSANAGEMTVSGAASMNIGGYSGENANQGTSFTMGNQITFTGGGELDNGMSVSLSFQLDNGTANAVNGNFDDHSVTVSSDTLGSLTLAGHGGSSAVTAFDATAAGNIWDTFDGKRGVASDNSTAIVTALGMSDTAPGNNSLMYTLPSLMDDLTINLSYQPQADNIDSGTGFAVHYTGIEGLSLSYGQADEVGSSTALSGEQTAYKISYAYGPVTVAYTNSDFDVQTAASDQDVTSMAVSYTISDEMSVTYGTEEFSTTSATDREYTVLKGSYTSGGMTVSAQMKEAENVAHGTASNQDFEYWGLGLAFAF
jgi:outer membrane protein OmpU